MSTLIPVIIFIQMMLPILIYIGSRGRHEKGAQSGDIFRFSPSIAWLTLIMSFAISLIVAVAILVTKPTPLSAPPSMMLGELMFFFFGLYGVYCVTVRIQVDHQWIRVNSFFRTQTIKLSDIRSVSDKDTGKWRTLDVIDIRGKRILYVTSSFLPDYDVLVDLLQEATKENAT